jgi:hypothetical protein
MTYRQPLKSASISIDNVIGNDAYRAVAKYCEGHGFDIDVFKNNVRIVMRNAAWPDHGPGDRDVALVSDTLTAAVDGRVIGNMVYL